MTLLEELQWRGLLHDKSPEIEQLLSDEKTSVYLGQDPTAESLHIGNLVPIILLKHLQAAGHTPILLVGGATGMIGDPSGKSAERNLLDETVLQHNQACIAEQVRRFVPGAEVVNNYDWMKDISFLAFIRDIGKYITVNYMMAKDSVKRRIEREGEGLSFTEFTYQLVQGYDFFHLFQAKNCKLQIGGSDQWGNITTGIELIRKKLGGQKAYGLTCPLITRADGSKFGKSEAGEKVWLDQKLTSPYKFYQFWINASDADAIKYIKLFTFLDKTTIENLIQEHEQAPHLRLVQKRLAQEVMTIVHGAEAYEKAVQTSQILFGKGTKDTLLSLSENDLLDVFAGVPTFTIPKTTVEASLDITALLAEKTTIYASKSEARRGLKGNSVSVNKQKVAMDYTISTTDLLKEKYILVQKGKKKYNLVIVE